MTTVNARIRLKCREIIRNHAFSVASTNENFKELSLELYVISHGRSVRDLCRKIQEGGSKIDWSTSEVVMEPVYSASNINIQS